MTGERAAYEDVCQRLVTTFATSSDPYVAERIAQDCLRLPNSGADLVLMDQLADKAVSAGSASDGFPYFLAARQCPIIGWDPARIARAWAALMKRLGYTKFVAQGGDWGAIVVDVMAHRGIRN